MLTPIIAPASMLIAVFGPIIMPCGQHVDTFSPGSLPLVGMKDI